MGACIGKKSSKYLLRKISQSDRDLNPQSKEQNEVATKKSPTQIPKEIIVTEDCSGENDDNQRISKLDGSSINSELQTILEEQKVINDVLSQPFPSRVVSCTDTELELELAAIVLSENPENHFEQTPVTPAVTDQKDV